MVEPRGGAPTGDKRGALALQGLPYLPRAVSARHELATAAAKRKSPVVAGLFDGVNYHRYYMGRDINLFLPSLQLWAKIN